MKMSLKASIRFYGFVELTFFLNQRISYSYLQQAMIKLNEHENQQASLQYYIYYGFRPLINASKSLFSVFSFPNKHKCS